MKCHTRGESIYAFCSGYLKNQKDSTERELVATTSLTKRAGITFFIEERAMDIRKKTRAFFSFLTAVID